jgi:Ca-activated chloride channel family protein
MATIQLLSSAMKPSSVGMQGTSIAAAIQMAMKSFPQKEGFHKVIIILSDGEDHEGESVEAAKSAHEAGVTIFTVPVGTTQGGALPNLDQPGEGYKRDEKGNVIISIPNRDLLDQIASAAQGERIELQDGENGFDKMKKRFSSLAKKEITYQSFSEYQSYFQFPLFLALIIWLGDVLINRRKK